jgi:hypothetical protein
MNQDIEPRDCRIDIIHKSCSVNDDAWNPGICTGLPAKKDNPDLLAD